MELYLVLFTVLFLAVVCLGTFIALLKRKVWLFLFIPLTLLIVMSVMHTYTSLLGTPTEKYLPEEFFLLSHHVVEVEDVIYIWVVPSGETVPVAHTVPYTADLHEELERLKKTAGEEGPAAAIRGYRTEDSDTTTFEMYYFIQQEYLQKDD
jgi:hypothetical protein